MRRLAVLAAGLLAACAVEPPPPPPPPPGWLDGTAWSLAELRGAPAPFIASIRFEGDQMRGTASCNRYFGAFVQTGDAVEVSAVAASRAACPEAEAEDLYFSTLTDIARAELSEGRLTFYAADGAPLLAYTGG